MGQVSAKDCYCTASALLERAALGGARQAGLFSSKAHEYRAHAELLLPDSPGDSKRIQRTFKLMDVDNDGSISREEFREGVDMLLRPQHRAPRDERTHSSPALHMVEWSIAIVTQWVRDIAGVSDETASLLSSAGVDGQLLVHLSSSDLKEIGIDSRLERKRILARVAQVLQSDPARAPFVAPAVGLEPEPERWVHEPQQVWRETQGEDQGSLHRSMPETEPEPEPEPELELEPESEPELEPPKPAAVSPTGSPSSPPPRPSLSRPATLATPSDPPCLHRASTAVENEISSTERMRLEACASGVSVPGRSVDDAHDERQHIDSATRSRSQGTQGAETVESILGGGSDATIAQPLVPQGDQGRVKRLDQGLGSAQITSSGSDDHAVAILMRTSDADADDVSDRSLDIGNDGEDSDSRDDWASALVAPSLLDHFDSISGPQWKPSQKPDLRRHDATTVDGTPRVGAGTRRRFRSTRARSETSTQRARNEGEIQRIVTAPSGAEAEAMRFHGSAAGASAASMTAFVGRSVPDNASSSGGRGRWVPRRPPPTSVGIKHRWAA